MGGLKLLAELGIRQRWRLGCCLALVIALMLAHGSPAHAGLLFTFTDNSCSSPCGSNWGTVTVAQDISGNQEIDFTINR